MKKNNVMEVLYWIGAALPIGFLGVLVIALQA